MAEYEFRKQEQAYEVAPGVVFVDNSVSYDPVEKTASKVSPFQSQRLMEGRGIGFQPVDQQQRVMVEAISRGYKKKKDPNMGPYDSDKKDEERTKGMWAAVPKGISFGFGSSGGKGLGNYSGSSGIGSSYAGKN